ncbi:MAG: MerR family transcriptional regulator [Candidatus Binatia bacterium]
MNYSVAELGRATGLSVDTIRYYQGLGLLSPPAKRGRKAVYSDEHFERLQVVRSMANRGLPLKIIALLLNKPTGNSADQALLAAIEESAGAQSYSAEELAVELGIPVSLLKSIEKTGLAEAQIEETGGSHYSDSDLSAARQALDLLSYGFPLHKLLALAVRHDRAIRKTVDEAIDLFNAHVRKSSRGQDDKQFEEVADAFAHILPVVTGLVAHHFQRVLVNRALKRLKKSGDREPLKTALEVAGKRRVGIRYP